MAQINEVSIDEEMVSRLGLRITEKHINADISPDSRVFEYPNLEDVFVMESDLYGNPMPKDSCFLAFYGQHGLMGKHLKVETLANTSADDIKKMVESNVEG